MKEDKRLAAERRGDMDLRFAKWTVSFVFLEEREGMKGMGVVVDDGDGG